LAGSRLCWYGFVETHTGSANDKHKIEDSYTIYPSIAGRSVAQPRDIPPSPTTYIGLQRERQFLSNFYQH
jgi:hypothetical protein